MNIVEYAKISNESFADRPFGEVDSLVLCQVAYLRLPDLRDVPLGQLFELCRDNLQQVAPAHTENNTALLEALADSYRFGEVRMLEQRSVFDVATSCQFSATLFAVGDLEYFACRGTDGTLVGWKEDLDLMYKEDIAAQTHALEWLNSLTGRRLVVGGHSKGGNLAVYAAAFCDKAVQDNIQAVYNHDGPGFMPVVLEREGYRRVLDRAHKTVPEMCVFGHILVDEIPYTVIKSMGNNVYEHLAFNWQCNADGTFVLGKGITVSSQIVRSICDTIVPAMTMEEREVFVTTVYESLRSADVNRVGDIASFATVAKALSYNRRLSKDLRAKMAHCTQLFLSVAWGSSVNITEEYIGATFNEWRAKRQEKKKDKEFKLLRLAKGKEEVDLPALPHVAADTTDNED